MHTQAATFGTGTLDVEWLPKVGAAGWILLTKDQNIRRHPLEMRAFMESRVRAFVLTAGNLTGEEQAHVFGEAIPAMKRLIKRVPAPFIARVSKESSVQLIDVSRWLK